MDLELDDYLVDLRDNFRRQLSAVCDHDIRRAAMNLPGAVDRNLWRQLGDAGVFALTVPETAGGTGAGLVEAVIVHEEIGRAIVPGPVVATVVFSAIVPEARDGSLVVTAAFDSDTARIVEHLAGADTVLIASPAGFTTVPATMLLDVAEPLDDPLDPLGPVHRCPAWPEGLLLLSGHEAEAAWRTATLLTAATSIGLAAAAIDMATAYAQDRWQFDRPIGSFQAVKHLLADAFAETEIARAAVHVAAVTCDETAPEPERWRLVSCARLLASRAAQRAARAAIQVHGGMGFTWDLDAHLLLKRTLVLDTHFDVPARARARLEATYFSPGATESQS